MSEIIQVENKYYISVNSTYADDRVRVLNHIDTFGIFDRWGDIKQIGEEVQGIYYGGMRFISELEFRINGHRPLLLSSAVKEENEILSVDLTNPALLNGQSIHSIPKGVLYIGRSKFIRNGACFEQIIFNNYGHAPYDFEVSFGFNADFKDIFEVRGIKRDKRGEVYEIKHLPDKSILISYEGLDEVKRFSEINFSRKPDSWEEHSKAVFYMHLEPHQQKLLEYALHFRIGKEPKKHVSYALALNRVKKEMKDCRKTIAEITTSNHQFSSWISRSQYDLLSLLADTEHGKYPYAGVPWYNTAFGRDGIITAIETLWVAPDIAKDVLNFLACTQATEENEYQDAQPGKIVHEIRSGEMAELNEIPFKRYYGTVDATPLFVMLAGYYYRRTADIKFIRKIWPNILAAIRWIDQYGDIDGDGFVDYSNRSVNGLVNQGWKDSHDSISHSDGMLAIAPVALCEVQGYVYEAKMQAAMLAEALGENKLADKLRQQAANLKKQFNEKFWNEEMQCYVLALDGTKRPCRITTSNAGQCLFTGIVDDDKAKKLADRLMQEDMFSGWGIRTLSTKEKRYNPMSYHNGSVWPHDVALIVMGFAQYGFREHVLKLTDSLFSASLFLELQRLPELFCGFDRREGEGPTEYPVACSPQSWSVAAVYLLLKACLNIHINALEKKIYLHKPVLPEKVDRVTVSNLNIGAGFAHLEVYCKDGAVGVKTKSCADGWEILLVTE